MKLSVWLVLCLAGWANAQEIEPVLLTEAPDRWRFERLDFPLQFAPDLKLEGFEELRFAPGMFEPGSQSYFSYVMAMQIENLTEIDKKFVGDLFQQYFTGLCKAVGESRDLELDLDKIKTEVEQDEDIFHVKVSIYDPFVTGQPLKLNLQVTSHQSADDAGIVLLGLASPAADDAEIWKQLESFRTRFKTRGK